MKLVKSGAKSVPQSITNRPPFITGQTPLPRSKAVPYTQNRRSREPLGQIKIAAMAAVAPSVRNCTKNFD